MIDRPEPIEAAPAAHPRLVPEDEPETVRLAQAGSEPAFARLYEHYAGRVYRYGLVRTGQVSDAEDLVGQTFLRVVEALPRYRDRGLPFGAWVFSIARHALADRRRGQRPWATLSPDDPGPTVIDHAPAAIEYAVLREALGRITRDQRDVIVYRFFSDLSVRETARLMGRDEGAVRNLQARALAALRRVLRGDADVFVALRGGVPT
jgi:RNA polymerase sigma-70 factor (ECF subfamily)